VTSLMHRILPRDPCVRRRAGRALPGCQAPSDDWGGAKPVKGCETSHFRARAAVWRVIRPTRVPSRLPDPIRVYVPEYVARAPSPWHRRFAVGLSRSWRLVIS